jgi:hypothetical protein
VHVQLTNGWARLIDLPIKNHLMNATLGAFNVLDLIVFFALPHNAFKRYCE